MNGKGKAILLLEALMCEFRNEINFLVEHTSCSSYVRMIVLTKYCKMVNRGVYIETP